ncbi:MAG: hypothetical protein U0136_19825 [Bdellovibrionota bacterium]
MRIATQILFVALASLLPSVCFAQDCTPHGGDDCNKNGIADSCDVSRHTSADCNATGIPDECELGESEIVVSPTGFKAIKSNDCNLSGVPDECKPDCNNSGTPDVCKDDLNQDGRADACVPASECKGSCNSQFVAFDEDQDGVSNCQEAQDHTSACDSGSFVPRLAPAACGGPNGFFGQINIATVVNHLSRTMKVRAEYRDSTGVVRGSVSFDLPANLKRDLIINDMGLVPDSYGTFCVLTDATTMGAWSGGITAYKRRNVQDNGFDSAETFDFALYYPFANPLLGPISLPLNTFTIGTDGKGTVANWIRLTDAIVGDNHPLVGTLSYFDASGALVGTDAVNIPNGGRQDFGAHAKLGPNAVGLAQFVPASNGDDYYIELTRYFYEGTGATSDKFYTAFPVPIHRPTGAAVTGKALAAANELSIFEFVNATSAAAAVNLQVFNSAGADLMSQGFNIPAFGTIHRVITNELSASSTPPASAQLAGPKNSIDSMTAVYGFDKGNLLYAYAPQFYQSAGTKQFTEFNSFIGHANFLELINSTDKPITAQVSLINFDQSPISSFQVALPPRGTDRRQLTVPSDSYGTIVVDTGSDSGVVVRNDVTRPGQYVMPFFGQ